MSEEAIYCIVSGRVQGVGFRASCQSVAAELGLRGWVRNRADGGVEVYAEGAHAALARFRAWLGQGPKLAHVDHVECEEAVPEHLSGFEIRY